MTPSWTSFSPSIEGSNDSSSIGGSVERMVKVLQGTQLTACRLAAYEEAGYGAGMYDSESTASLVSPARKAGSAARSTPEWDAFKNEILEECLKDVVRFDDTQRKLQFNAFVWMQLVSYRCTLSLQMQAGAEGALFAVLSNGPLSQQRQVWGLLFENYCRPRCKRLACSSVSATCTSEEFLSLSVQRAVRTGLGLQDGDDDDERTTPGGSTRGAVMGVVRWLSRTHSHLLLLGPESIVPPLPKGAVDQTRSNGCTRSSSAALSGGCGGSENWHELEVEVFLWETASKLVRRWARSLSSPVALKAPPSPVPSLSSSSSALPAISSVTLVDQRTLQQQQQQQQLQENKVNSSADNNAGGRTIQQDAQATSGAAAAAAATTRAGADCGEGVARLLTDLTHPGRCGLISPFLCRKHVPKKSGRSGMSGGGKSDANQREEREEEEEEEEEEKAASASSGRKRQRTSPPEEATAVVAGEIVGGGGGGGGGGAQQGDRRPPSPPSSISRLSQSFVVRVSAAAESLLAALFSPPPLQHRNQKDPTPAGTSPAGTAPATAPATSAAVVAPTKENDFGCGTEECVKGAETTAATNDLVFPSLPWSLPPSFVGVHSSSLQRGGSRRLLLGSFLVPCLRLIRSSLYLNAHRILLALDDESKAQTTDDTYAAESTTRRSNLSSSSSETSGWGRELAFEDAALHSHPAQRAWTALVEAATEEHDCADFATHEPFHQLAPSSSSSSSPSFLATPLPTPSQVSPAPSSSPPPPPLAYLAHFALFGCCSPDEQFSGRGVPLVGEQQQQQHFEQSLITHNNGCGGSSSSSSSSSKLSPKASPVSGKEGEQRDENDDGGDWPVAFRRALIPPLSSALMNSSESPAPPSPPRNSKLNASPSSSPSVGRAAAAPPDSTSTAVPSPLGAVALSLAVVPWPVLAAKARSSSSRLRSAWLSLATSASRAQSGSGVGLRKEAEEAGEAEEAVTLGTLLVLGCFAAPKTPPLRESQTSDSCLDTVGDDVCAAPPNFSSSSSSSSSASIKKKTNTALPFSSKAWFDPLTVLHNDLVRRLDQHEKQLQQQGKRKQAAQLQRKKEKRLKREGGGVSGDRESDCEDADIDNGSEILSKVLKLVGKKAAELQKLRDLSSSRSRGLPRSRQDSRNSQTVQQQPAKQPSEQRQEATTAPAVAPQCSPGPSNEGRGSTLANSRTNSAQPATLSPSSSSSSSSSSASPPFRFSCLPQSATPTASIEATSTTTTDAAAAGTAPTDNEELSSSLASSPAATGAPKIAGSSSSSSLALSSSSALPSSSLVVESLRVAVQGHASTVARAEQEVAAARAEMALQAQAWERRLALLEKAVKNAKAEAIKLERDLSRVQGHG